MMESVKPARERKTEQHSLRPAVLHAVYGGLGFLAANGAVMGNLAPFGAALTAEFEQVEDIYGGI